MIKYADRTQVDDPIRWGKLVKSWATGRSYMGEGTAVPPVPRTLDDLKSQCAAYGISIKIPEYVKALSVFQYSPETLALRLPPRDMVESSEAKMEDATFSYPIPTFYSDFLRNPPKSHAQKLELHAGRVGDYSISNCT
jgi:hypothetical protein